MTLEGNPQISTRLLLALGAVCALMGCTQAPPRERAGDEMAKPEGTILGGDISDDMVPLERLRSQSPLLEASAQAARATPQRTPGVENAMNVDDEVSPQPGSSPRPPED